MNESIFKKAPLPIRRIPQDWDYQALGDLIDFQNGYAFNSKNYTDVGKVIIRMSNISTQGRLQVNDQNVRHCSNEDYDNLSNYHLEKDDLVICMTDVTPEKAIVGRTAVIDENNYYILNQRVGRIRTNDLLCNYFLHYYTNFNDYLNYIRNRTPGSAQFNLSTQEIKNVKVPLPPIKEQQKIAAILSSVDEAIEKTEQIIEQTERVKKGLMQELLTKGIGHTEFKDSPVGYIPKEWAYTTIDTLCEVKTGGTPSRKESAYWDEGEIKWMASGDIHLGRVYDVDGRITQKGLANSNARLLPKNTVMIALNGQGKTRGTVAILKNSLTCNQSLAGFIPNDKYVSEFLYYNLQSRYNEIRNYTGDGSRTGLNLKILKEIKLALPSLEEQEKIVEILTVYDNKLKNNVNRKIKLLMIKQGLMQELLTGKKRVKVDDGEEVLS